LAGTQQNLVGIDLGTTFSVIAHLDAKGKAVTLPNKDGDPLTPSAVYLNGNSAVVSKSAREAATADATRVALWVKRDMGGMRYSHTVDGRTFRPETLSAIILRKLKQSSYKTSKYAKPGRDGGNLCPLSFNARMPTAASSCCWKTRTAALRSIACYARCRSRSRPGRRPPRPRQLPQAGFRRTWRVGPPTQARKHERVPIAAPRSACPPATLAR
jgi:hypothetical protein